MATSKEPPASGFSPEEKAELSAMIAEAVKGAVPPAAGGDPAKPAPPKVSDDQWDAMSDRQRESFVRQIVDHHLGELAKEDEAAALREKVAKLEAGTGGGAAKAPDGERPPSVVTKLQRWLWGAEPEPSK